MPIPSTTADGLSHRKRERPAVRSGAAMCSRSFMTLPRASKNGTRGAAYPTVQRSVCGRERNSPPSGLTTMISSIVAIPWPGMVIRGSRV